MKRWQWVPSLLLASACATASPSDMRVAPSNTALATNSIIERPSSLSAPKLRKLHRKQMSQTNLVQTDFAEIRGGVAKEMRATSAFVEENAVKAETADSWLIALAAFGLIFLQLRRKHKSLPQIRILPYT
jgi:hypothetical protein